MSMFRSRRRSGLIVVSRSLGCSPSDPIGGLTSLATAALYSSRDRRAHSSRGTRSSGTTTLSPSHEQCRPGIRVCKRPGATSKAMPSVCPELLEAPARLNYATAIEMIYRQIELGGSTPLLGASLPCEVFTPD